MALYNELPVYKSTYRLLLKLVGMSVGWQRDYRYTLGQELKAELVDLLVKIYRANSIKDKFETLSSARESIERVKIYVRLLRDLRQIGIDAYAALADETAGISKQLAAWHSKCSCARPSQSDNFPVPAPYDGDSTLRE